MYAIIMFIILTLTLSSLTCLRDHCLPAWRLKGWVVIGLPYPGVIRIRMQQASDTNGTLQNPFPVPTPYRA